MIKIENISVYGFEEAIRGMRNPMNSWELSDSHMCRGAEGFEDCHVSPLGECPRKNDFKPNVYCIGENDLNLMKKLFKVGTEHRKYDRMINVYMDIEASHTFWTEFDTYKIGVVRNSCSKMHKIHVKPFSYEDFDHEGIDTVSDNKPNNAHESIIRDLFKAYIEELEFLRNRFNETKEKKYWRALIEMLPMGFRLKATVMMNYEVCARIVEQRSNHKLDEWHVLCDEIKKLPYFTEITGGTK